MMAELDERTLAGISGGTTVDEQPKKKAEKKGAEKAGGAAGGATGGFKEEAVKFAKKIVEEAYEYAKKEVGKDFELHEAAPAMHLGRMEFGF
jgi:hypothetical protein